MFACLFTCLLTYRVATLPAMFTEPTTPSPTKSGDYQVGIKVFH